MSEPTARDEAREAAIYSLIASLISLALQVGIMVAFARRDALTRMWLRYRWHVYREWRKADEHRLIAELREDISRMEHDGIRPA